MSEQETEWLSALTDDEADARERQRVKELLADPDLMRIWSRYQLISDCMNRRLPERLDREQAESICQALRKEPVIVSLSSVRRSFLRPVGGFAIAASVAAMAILGLQEQAGGIYPQALPDISARSVPEPATRYHGLRAPVRQVSGQVAGSVSMPVDCAQQPADDGARADPAPDAQPEAVADACR